MSNKIADVIAYSGGVQIQLPATEAQYLPGAASPYQGADASAAVVRRAGKLGVKAQYSGWYSTSFLEVTFLDGRSGDFVFEVTRTFKAPYEEDGWIWFAVIPKSVSPYRE